jgi:hypothetical protein
VATPERVSEADAIILEVSRGQQTIPVTLHFAAMRQIREALESPATEHTGPLFGDFTSESISIQPSGDGVQIGIYRAQPGGWPALTDDDRKKIHAATAAGGLLLVIRTLAQRPWAATLYALDFALAPASETPLAEFPFDEYLLRNGWLTDLAPPPPPQPIGVVSPFTRRRLTWAAGAVAAVLVAGSIAYRRSGLPITAAVPGDPARASGTPLALHLTRSADDIEFSWSPSSDAVRRAAAGTVIIRNGPVLRTIELTPEQLREGRIVYHPLSGVDVNARLEVITSEEKWEAASVQFLGFDTTSTPSGPVAAPPRPAPPARPAPRTAATHRSERAQNVSSAARHTVPAGPRSEPVAVRRASPELNRDVQAEMRAAKGKISVTVQASIDSAGTVQGVKVVSSTGEPSPSGPYIRLAALNAARQWKFRPATAGGKAVPSQTTMVFNF